MYEITIIQLSDLSAADFLKLESATQLKMLGSPTLSNQWVITNTFKMFFLSSRVWGNKKLLEPSHQQKLCDLKYPVRKVYQAAQSGAHHLVFCLRGNGITDSTFECSAARLG